MKYYKVYYTNTYDEANVVSFEVVDSYQEALDAMEDYNNNPYYTDVYVTEGVE